MMFFGKALLSEVLFQRNSANTGGAVNAISSTLLIVLNSVLTQNTATQGGGLYLQSSTGLLADVTVNENKATTGGACYITASSLVMKRAQCQDNVVTSTGGVATLADANITVSASSLQGNIAALVRIASPCSKLATFTGLCLFCRAEAPCMQATCQTWPLLALH